MQSSRVFISHSSKDNAFVQLVVAKLRSPDMAPWIDSEQIVTGDDIFDQLGHSLQSMDVLVFLISQTALKSGWVALEVKFAIKREITEKRVLVLPFIIDDTPTSALPWFLSHRNVSRVVPDADGATSVVTSVRTALERRSGGEDRDVARRSQFKRDPRIDNLIKNVKVGNWEAADTAALEMLAATNQFGKNGLFETLTGYLDHLTDEDMLWGTLMTIESCIQLAPWLADRELLFRMADHSDFSVRSSAASICMDLAQFAPDRVPTDILLKLSVHNEDWYVQAPATAALKTMARFQPAVLRIFMTRLHSPNPDARAHAAAALAGIAEQEPEILDPEELTKELADLERLGDKEAKEYIAKALSGVQKAKQTIRYKYGI